MNAIEPSQPPVQPAPNRRIVPRTQRQQRRHPNRAIAIETTAKLAVNVVLSSAAIAALVQLLPYHLSQQAKLREVRSEVKRAEERVKNLRSDFSHSFDSGQAQSIMQEQTFLVDPTKRQVVWQDRGIKDEN